MMTEYTQIVLAVAQFAGTALIVGVAYGKIMERLKSDARWRIEITKMLGNGEPGIFVRRRELELMRESADDEHGELRRRLTSLENK